MAQIFCLDGDREGNVVRIENALAEARDQGANIVCFPECALLGWVNPAAHERANPVPGPESERLGELARRYGVWMCIGIEEKAGEQLHNAALLIDNQGEIRLKHRKINLLVELMTPPYTPGDSIQAVETPFGRIGVMICADTFVEENLRRMAALEPDLVLAPFGWAEREEAWPQHGEKLLKTIARAARVIGAPVVGTDLVGMITQGPWAGRVYGGQSVAVDAQGNVLARAKDRDREIAIVEIGG